ncbi:MAG: carboxymuconolactone decarboxylase family protein [Acetobacteraceae bacterium]|nr:carboxymuconolactone decarboxylase family protein [Acetobacteraceae bacterium]
MPRLPLLSPADAPPAVRERLLGAEQANGFLPNLLRVLANAPAALEAYQTLSAINARASLALAEREAVQITAAATHGCGFCVAGHSAIATKKAGLFAEAVEALRSLAPPPDARLAAVADFTAAVIRSRGRVADAELAAFRAAGFSDAEALEVVLGVALATLCNFANNLADPPLNAELEPFRWPGAPRLAAE